MRLSLLSRDILLEGIELKGIFWEKPGIITINQEIITAKTENFPKKHPQHRKLSEKYEFINVYLRCVTDVRTPSFVVC